MNTDKENEYCFLFGSRLVI